VSQDCPICLRGHPTDVVAELDGAWVTVPGTAPLRGYVCVVAKRHVREPFELPEAERLAFWSAVDATARAIHEGLVPHKLNYEIHGNTIAHLHVHLFPRWRGDRFDGRPIDPRETDTRSREEREATLAALRGLPRMRQVSN
jgi:diadenosine tetraphosphate (Ap4A) HIT family hydrolase